MCTVKIKLVTSSQANGHWLVDSQLSQPAKNKYVFQTASLLQSCILLLLKKITDVIQVQGGTKKVQFSPWHNWFQYLNWKKCWHCYSRVYPYVSGQWPTYWRTPIGQGAVNLPYTCSLWSVSKGENKPWALRNCPTSRACIAAFFKLI